MEAVNTQSQFLLLAPALAKGQGDSIHPAALLAVRGRRPSLVAELSTHRHTGLIYCPSTLLTNFTEGWESHGNSLRCMFI